MTDKTDPTPPTPDPAAPPSGGKPSGADGHTYDLVPDDPATGPSRLPKLDAPGLTDDFDEDADFDHDPAMPKPPPPKAPPPPPADTFVKTGFGNPQVIGTAAIACAVGATILAAALGAGPWYKSVVLSLYHVGLQTLAGVVAVVFAARMVEKPMGSLELAAARMLLAVSLARAVLPLDFGVPGTGRFLEGLAVIGAYALVTWALFRLPRTSWFVMVATHAILLIVLWLGSSIEVWAGAEGPVKVAPTAPAAISG